jgi:hypothetical protein
LQREQQGVKEGRPAAPAGAAEKRLEEMEKKLDALRKEVEALRRELRPKGKGASRGAAPEKAAYINKRTFAIPYRLNRALGAAEVVLFVSENEGRSYHQVGTASRPDTAFQFRAPADGWYLFATRPRAKDGRNSPDEVRWTAPDLRVCVDTTPPAIQISKGERTAGGVKVSWEVTDENLDPSSVTVLYRGPGSREWRALPQAQPAKGSHVWSAAQAPDEVSIGARDRAGNRAELVRKLPTAAARPGQ